MVKRFMDVLRNEEGAVMVEYALIIVLVAVAAMGIWGNLVTALGDVVTRIKTALAG